VAGGHHVRRAVAEEIRHDQVIALERLGQVPDRRPGVDGRAPSLVAAPTAGMSWPEADQMITGRSMLPANLTRARSTLR
jgi:hypothetical protein